MTPTEPPRQDAFDTTDLGDPDSTSPASSSASGPRPIRGREDEEEPIGADLTPRRIVEELDRDIVGQDRAKRAVALALRDRWRRRRLPEETRRWITPKNILMIGPTGVGKTEIARRLAQLVGAPFVKVEATKYTEVGYIGRDVESMVRDLVEAAISLVKERERKRVASQAQARAEERLIDLLLPGSASSSATGWGGGSPRRPPAAPPFVSPFGFPFGTSAPAASDSDAATDSEDAAARERRQRSRDKLRAQLREGKADHLEVELVLPGRAAPPVSIIGAAGAEQMEMELQSMFERMMPRPARPQRMTVAEARPILIEREVEALLDPETIQRSAIRLAEESGIIFIDEIDKVAGEEGAGGGGRGPDVSRGGVQRDLLPIVEGTTVTTKYGPVKTDYVLFIAAGAFHKARPSDLMPELQGRFPIRVELDDLTRDDFARILREPRVSLLNQYQALLAVEGVQLQFTPDAIDAMAEIAYQVNRSTQNIGARRLHTILERVVEEISFNAPDQVAQTEDPLVVTIDAAEVRRKLDPLVRDDDLSRFIL
ncbi:heat shock protein HslVU, ATPase subunit HslU [Isosphaera pallida ATCC 43644]|uniref:Heat shock protein HslVU, ATPase subunit HslU n=1 Tax=Isosphaera pallida (strain ATCC 43644 / DSM 9630 / IS1B) TaxID=575540 RepID=E8R667_ISOPI|nr:ATP-dependent protease ATPase subunit HslU [Isosphaera pallida]ADV60762.1 heat shock protein HslVU, ATPase subunit HslU [Isosphaera pallida ATCC 43644]